MSQVKDRRKKVLLALLAALLYIPTLKIVAPPILRRLIEYISPYNFAPPIGLVWLRAWSGDYQLPSGFLVAPPIVTP